MSKVRVAGFGLSLDGFSAGIEQSLNDPLGKRGPEIFQWFFPYQDVLRAMHGEGGQLDRCRRRVRTAVDGKLRRFYPWPKHVRSDPRPMAGRLVERMVGSPNPPYHAPTFVLTHYERDPVVMEGGTTFYFISGGIEEALRLAKQAAGDKDVKIGGGVSTVRQYLQAGLIDSLHLALTPVALGQGEALLTGIDLSALGFL